MPAGILTRTTRLALNVVRSGDQHDQTWSASPDTLAAYGISRPDLYALVADGYLTGPDPEHLAAGTCPPGVYRQVGERYFAFVLTAAGVNWLAADRLSWGLRPLRDAPGMRLGFKTFCRALEGDYDTVAWLHTNGLIRLVHANTDHPHLTLGDAEFRNREAFAVCITGPTRKLIG